jgi:uncharacterized protein (DUF2235 family)
MTPSQYNQMVQLYVSAMTKDGDDKPKALKFRAKFSSKVCVSDQEEDWRCENWKDYKKGSAIPLNIKYVGVWDTVDAVGFDHGAADQAGRSRRGGHSAERRQGA